jgi:hypothetical protein
MDYPVNLPGFEGQQLVVRSAGMWQGPQLLVNGLPATKGQKRGDMLLRTNDGREVIASWKSQFFDVPQLTVDGQTVKVVEPLKWYQWLWSGLPISLIFVGGMIGGLVGMLGFILNTRIFRSNQSNVVQYLLTGLVSALTVVLYIVLVVIILSIFGFS